MFFFGIATSLIFFKNNLPMYAFLTLYFSLMQMIHYYGYIHIDDCKNKINQTMAYLNFIHIAFQPLVYLLGIREIFKRYGVISAKQYSQLTMVIFIAGLCGIFHVLRLFKAGNQDPQTNCIYCGKQVCSTTGVKHIQFHLPLRTNPVYVTPNEFTHFMLTIFPLLMFNNTTRAVALLCFLSMMTPTLIWPSVYASESASIWCFGSVLQISATAVFVALK